MIHILPTVMSAPAPDPPPNPSGAGDNKPADAAASSSSSGEAPTGEGQTTTNPEGGDVKMDEPPKPEEIEDTLEDIPDHVRDVSRPFAPARPGKQLTVILRRTSKKSRCRRG